MCVTDFSGVSRGFSQFPPPPAFAVILAPAVHRPLTPSVLPLGTSLSRHMENTSLAPQCDDNPHPLCSAGAQRQAGCRARRGDGGGRAWEGCRLTFPHPSPLCRHSPSGRLACATFTRPTVQISGSFLVCLPLLRPQPSHKRVPLQRRLAGGSLPGCAPRHDAGRRAGGCWGGGEPRGPQRPETLRVRLPPEPLTTPQPEPRLPPPSLPPSLSGPARPCSRPPALTPPPSPARPPASPVCAL